LYTQKKSKTTVHEPTDGVRKVKRKERTVGEECRLQKGKEGGESGQ